MVDEEVFLPPGTIVTIDSVAAQERHRGGLFRYNRKEHALPIPVKRRILAAGSQTRGRWGWTIAGESNVMLYLDGPKGTYKPGTPIVTDHDPLHPKRR